MGGGSPHRSALFLWPSSTCPLGWALHSRGLGGCGAGHSTALWRAVGGTEFAGTSPRSSGPNGESLRTVWMATLYCIRMNSVLLLVALTDTCTSMGQQARTAPRQSRRRPSLRRAKVRASARSVWPSYHQGSWRLTWKPRGGSPSSWAIWRPNLPIPVPAPSLGTGSGCAPGRWEMWAPDWMAARRNSGRSCAHATLATRVSLVRGCRLVSLQDERQCARARPGRYDATRAGIRASLGMSCTKTGLARRHRRRD